MVEMEMRWHILIYEIAQTTRVRAQFTRVSTGTNTNDSEVNARKNSTSTVTVSCMLLLENDNR